MRANEIRLLTWEQVDFPAKSLVVGKSKTAAGTGRIIPLNLRALAMLTHWHYEGDALLVKASKRNLQPS
jgi:integrase